MHVVSERLISSCTARTVSCRFRPCLALWQFLPCSKLPPRPVIVRDVVMRSLLCLSISRNCQLKA